MALQLQSGVGNHVMIDLETMGTRWDAPILAIGAVRFQPETGIFDSEAFYRAIDPVDALKYGTLSGSTLKWWMRQSEAARDAAMKGDMSLTQALVELVRFIRPGDRVWGNGATFDITILEHAYVATQAFKSDNGGCPWDFRNVRDCRTIKELAEGRYAEPPFEGTQHDALADAIHQARWVSLAWQALRGGLPPVRDNVQDFSNQFA